MKKYIILSVTTVILLAAKHQACAQTVSASFNNYDTPLGGATRDLQWDGFSAATAPAGVSANTAGKASQWTSGIAPSNDGSSPARFSGQAAFGADTTDFLTSDNGGGVYAFFSQTHFSLSNTAPLAGMKSIVLQIDLAEGLTGMFGGTPAKLAALPTLTIQTMNGSQTLDATFSLQLSSTPAVLNGMSTNIDLLTYQWDLSSVADPIQSYSLNWQDSYHSILIGEKITESDAVVGNNILAIPEPSTYVCFFMGLGLFAWRHRRRMMPARN